MFLTLEIHSDIISSNRRVLHTFLLETLSKKWVFGHFFNIANLDRFDIAQLDCFKHVRCILNQSTTLDFILLHTFYKKLSRNWFLVIIWRYKIQVRQKRQERQRGQDRQKRLKMTRTTKTIKTTIMTKTTRST